MVQTFPHPFIARGFCWLENPIYSSKYIWPLNRSFRLMHPTSSIFLPQLHPREFNHYLRTGWCVQSFNIAQNQHIYKENHINFPMFHGNVMDMSRKFQHFMGISCPEPAVVSCFFTSHPFASSCGRGSTGGHDDGDAEDVVWTRAPLLRSTLGMASGGEDDLGKMPWFLGGSKTFKIQWP